MIAARASHRSRLAFAWLVWLGLLLPAAQLFALGHGYSHQGERLRAVDPAASLAGEGDRDGPHARVCDLCLAGAALSGGGAAPAGGAVCLPPAAAGLQPGLAGPGIAPAAFAPVYRSRAPPLA